MHIPNLIFHAKVLFHEINVSTQTVQYNMVHYWNI